MYEKLKDYFGLLRPIEFAILINAFGISYLKFIPIGLTLLILTWIYELIISKSLIFEFKYLLKSSNFLLITSPFWLAIFGLIYSTNLTKGFEDLGRIIPFIAFPIIFLSFDEKRKNSLKYLLLFSFVFGIFFRFSINFYFSAIHYLNDSDFKHFFYAQLDKDTNIISILTLFGILFLHDYLLQKPNLCLKKNGLILVIISILCIWLLMLQSRIVILIFFITLGIFFIFHIRNKRKWNLVFSVVLSGLFMLIPAFQGRFQTVTSERENLSKNKRVTEVLPTQNVENLACMSSTELRYNSLKASWNIINRNKFIGVGTGDWLDELKLEYEKLKMPCNLHEETAPHNQYLRTALKFGITGLLIYFFYLFRLIRIGIKNRDIGQWPFLLTLVLCGFGYDLLDVGSSAPFFAFFSTWFFLQVKSPNDQP
jgi:O-antigen ligase